MAFTPVLEKLYAAQRARGAQQLEVVLVSRCWEAKGTKIYRKNMPWLATWHDAEDEVGMETRTSSLMAKYNITSIPALILLDKRGGLICADAPDKCVADPEGWAFPWRHQSQSAQAAETGSGAGTARGVEARSQTPAAREARRGPVVNFDLPPWARLQPELTCARPQVFAGGAGVGPPVGTQVGTPGGHASTSTRDGTLGLPVGSHVGKRDGKATTGSISAALGVPVGSSVGTQARQASTTGTAATAPIPCRDTGGRTQVRQGKRSHRHQTESWGHPRRQNRTLECYPVRKDK